jgi:hypothetical protein
MDVFYPLILHLMLDISHRYVEEQNLPDLHYRFKQAKWVLGLIPQPQSPSSSPPPKTSPSFSSDTDRDGGSTITRDAASAAEWTNKSVMRRSSGVYCPRRQIFGFDLVNFIASLIAWPDATNDEIAVHIYNGGGELYSDEVISKRRKEFNREQKKMPDVTNVRTSRDRSPDDFTQYATWAYWNSPPPCGVIGVPRKKFIDIVDFGVVLQKCRGGDKLVPKVQKIEKNGRCHRVGSNGLSVILAIEAGDPSLPAGVSGSIENPRRWIRCLRSTEIINTHIFADFCEDVCNDIEQHHRGPPEALNREYRTFLWETSKAHDNAYVVQTICGRESQPKFAYTYRPRNHPHFSPAEYKLCELFERLRLVEELYDWNIDTLEEVICGICYHRLGKFDAAFEHCGYGE